MPEKRSTAGNTRAGEMDKPRLSIAMCTYNGARYVREQLDSIARQSRLPEELVVCDDRSSDETVQLVSEFGGSAPFPVHIYVNEENLGAVANFEKALERCSGDYISFSDQDDVWLSDKLERALDAMKEAEQEYGTGVPLMVHTDLLTVDAERRPTARSAYKPLKLDRSSEEPLNELLVENYAVGCTQTLNRALKEVGLPFPPGALMHDWWLAAVAAATGRVISLPGVSMLYRQHSENAVGARKRDIRQYLLGWSKSVEKVQSRFLLSKALEKRLESYPVYADRVSFLERYHHQVRRGGPSAVRWLYREGVTMQAPSRTLVLYFFILVRAISPVLNTKRSAKP